MDFGAGGGNFPDLYRATVLSRAFRSIQVLNGSIGLVADAAREAIHSRSRRRWQKIASPLAVRRKHVSSCGSASRVPPLGLIRKPSAAIARSSAVGRGDSAEIWAKLAEPP